MNVPLVELIIFISRSLSVGISLWSGPMTNPSGFRDSSKFAMPQAPWLERLIALEGPFLNSNQRCEKDE